MTTKTFLKDKEYWLKHGNFSFGDWTVSAGQTHLNLEQILLTKSQFDELKKLTEFMMFALVPTYNQ
ncbi:hypothetical protein [Iningainema tapete]|uniref:Uncharacterized protein n=1 Tax=Iningainema tapete BLCC-T55 TaxID=2748662 RepID=A0A8J6XPM3_9CYAN|nr:hypothetical protein [Iningainema tapete]MBD2774142.1 hypothetical protein [Iningainema tapete BLCC-T55]